MATVKFSLIGKSGSANIICRFSHSRDINFRVKTGFVYDASRWSEKTQRPKDRNAEAKELTSNLDNLAPHIIDQFNQDFAKGVSICPEWLTYVIDKKFDRLPPEAGDYLTECAQHYIDELPYRVSDNGQKVGVTAETIAKYKNIKSKIVEFETHTKKRYLVKDVNSKFRTAFIKFLQNEKKISPQTIGRYLKFVKTFVLDAQKRGVEISPQITDFKGYTLKVPKIILDFDELEQIQKTHFTSEKLKITRDWLIIGCFTGQRVSDILRMNAKMIKQIEGFKFIELEQTKTKKTVQIPIHYEVGKILKKYNGNFPPPLAETLHSSATAFNKHLKTVAKQSGIVEVVDGYLRNEETERYEKGKFEKWQLITSHTCRRSFATNFYSLEEYPTPLLINITAHSSEKLFLEYIGKKPIDYSIQLAKIWAKDALRARKKSHLNIVTSKAANDE